MNGSSKAKSVRLRVEAQFQCEQEFPGCVEGSMSPIYILLICSEAFCKPMAYCVGGKKFSSADLQRCLGKHHHVGVQVLFGSSFMKFFFSFPSELFIHVF